MAANNNNPPPAEWFFGDDAALSQKTKDGLKQLMVYVWSLRGAQVETGNQVQNLNQNITNAITVISQNINQAIVNAGNRVIFGSHFDRGVLPPANYNGYLYVETDRNEALYGSNGVSWNLVSGTSPGNFETRYAGFNTQDAGFEWIETARNNQNGLPPYPLYRWDGSNWNFISGEFYRNQNALVTLANTFAANNSNNGNDVGARVNVVDFAGQLQWTATTANNNTTFGWNWGPDDCQMHGFGPMAVEVDPSPATAWQIYAGNNNVSYLKSDGSIGNVNLPDLRATAAVAFLEFGNNSSGNAVVPPVAPLFTGNNIAGNITGTFSGNGSGSSAAFSASDVAAGTGTTVLTGPNPVGVTVAVSGNISANLSGNAVTGTISNNGTPPSIIRKAWFRR